MNLADIILTNENDCWQFARRCIKTLEARGKPLRIRLSTATKDRSVRQNRALFGVAYPLVKESTGYREHEFHDLMCRKHFGETVVNLAGERFTRASRTTTKDEEGRADVLSAKEFFDFYEFVQGWCRSFFDPPLEIPDPDPELRKAA